MLSLRRCVVEDKEAVAREAATKGTSTRNQKDCGSE